MDSDSKDDKIKMIDFIMKDIEEKYCNEKTNGTINTLHTRIKRNSNEI